MFTRHSPAETSFINFTVTTRASVDCGYQKKKNICLKLTVFKFYHRGNVSTLSAQQGFEL